MSSQMMFIRVDSKIIAILPANEVDIRQPTQCEAIHSERRDADDVREQRRVVSGREGTDAEMRQKYPIQSRLAAERPLEKNPSAFLFLLPPSSRVPDVEVCQRNIVSGKNEFDVNANEGKFGLSFNWQG
ncbi:hypothetical protein CDAR_318971 [Caerostris darwini]|uniref:Uncharacterized protein n=1 Tax=Caerostris darwini TaxID=1538125 RepID=A0AAV4TV49_9ARAC|nr:hypothetical protein CDAR_318971 [Caerostris darwini]